MLCEAVDLAGHVLHDAETQLLGFLAFAMVLADEGDEAFGEADETDGEGALVDDGLDGVVVVELAAAEPQTRHQQRELLLEGGTNAGYWVTESVMDSKYTTPPSPVPDNVAGIGLYGNTDDTDALPPYVAVNIWKRTA